MYVHIITNLTLSFSQKLRVYYSSETLFPIGAPIKNKDIQFHHVTFILTYAKKWITKGTTNWLLFLTFSSCSRPNLIQIAFFFFVTILKMVTLGSKKTLQISKHILIENFCHLWFCISHISTQMVVHNKNAS